MYASRTLVDRRRVLDLNQANGLLPRVKILAARILRRVRLTHRLQNEVQVLNVLCDCSDNLRNPDFLEFVDKSVRYHRLRGQVDALVDHLAGLGGVVRERDASHVDFPFMRDDGLAFLCWKSGEVEIRHWHYMHETHEMRRSVHSATP